MTAYGHLRYIKNEGNFILGISKEGETSCLQNKVLTGHGLNANLQYNLKVVFFFFFLNHKRVQVLLFQRNSRWALFDVHSFIYLEVGHSTS